MELRGNSVADETLTFRIGGHTIDKSPLTGSLVGVIVIGALASLFDGGDAFLIGFAMPDISKEFALQPQTLGLIASSALIGMTLDLLSGVGSLTSGVAK